MSVIRLSARLEARASGLFGALVLVAAAALRLYPQGLKRRLRLRPNRSRRDVLENGAIAQLGERFNGIEEVVGSIPSGSTNTAVTAEATESGLAAIIGPGFRRGSVKAPPTMGVDNLIARSRFVRPEEARGITRISEGCFFGRVNIMDGRARAARPGTRASRSESARRARKGSVFSCLSSFASVRPAAVSIDARRQN
jgi:hypothetical protein